MVATVHVPTFQQFSKRTEHASRKFTKKNARHNTGAHPLIVHLRFLQSFNSPDALPRATRCPALGTPRCRSGRRRAWRIGRTASET